MPVVDGIEATRTINKHFPNTKVIALSMHNDDLVILDMMKAGAMGFADKAIKRDDLFFAIDQVIYHNERYITQSIERKMLMESVPTNDVHTKISICTFLPKRVANNLHAY